MLYVYNVCMLNCSSFCLTLKGVICNKVSVSDLYSACSLKQQLVDRYVATRGHIILIPSQSVFVLTP